MFFHMTIRKQTAYGMCFMNEQQSNSQEHEDCSKWQYEGNGKDIRASS